ARDLVDRLALQAQAEDEGRDLAVRRLVPHDELHRPGGLGLREVLAADQLGQELDHAGTSSRRAPARQFASSRLPSPVSTDSGGNGPPNAGRSRWRRAMTTPSAVLAATSSSGGSEPSSTISEWYRVASKPSGRPVNGAPPSWWTWEVLPCTGWPRTTRPPNAS